MSREEMFQEWLSLFKGGIDKEAFDKFLKRYSQLKKSVGWSKVSEPFFKLLLTDLVGNGVDYQEQYEIEVIDGVVKRFDVLVGGTLIEIKKNIDNVEGDLLKWVLLGDRGYKRVELIWEEKDNSSSQYSRILNHAHDKGWIDAWFYLTPTTFDVEIKQLKEFLCDHSLTSKSSMVNF